MLHNSGPGRISSKKVQLRNLWKDAKPHRVLYSWHKLVKKAVLQSRKLELRKKEENETRLMNIEDRLSSVQRLSTIFIANAYWQVEKKIVEQRNTAFDIHLRKSLAPQAKDVLPLWLQHSPVATLGQGAGRRDSMTARATMPHGSTNGSAASLSTSASSSSSSSTATASSSAGDGDGTPLDKDLHVWINTIVNHATGPKTLHGTTKMPGDATSVPLSTPTHWSSYCVSGLHREPNPGDALIHCNASAWAAAADFSYEEGAGCLLLPSEHCMRSWKTVGSGMQPRNPAVPRRLSSLSLRSRPQSITLIVIIPDPIPAPQSLMTDSDVLHPLTRRSMNLLRESLAAHSIQERAQLRKETANFFPIRGVVNRWNINVIQLWTDFSQIHSLHGFVHLNSIKDTLQSCQSRTVVLTGLASLRSITNTKWWHDLRKYLKVKSEGHKRIVALGAGHVVLAAALKGTVCPVDVAYLHGELPLYHSSLKVHKESKSTFVHPPSPLPVPKRISASVAAVLPPPWAEPALSDREIIGDSNQQSLHDMVKKAMVRHDEHGGKGASHTSGWQYSLYSIVGELRSARRRQETRRKRLRNLYLSPSTNNSQDEGKHSTPAKSLGHVIQSIFFDLGLHQALRQHSLLVGPTSATGMSHLASVLQRGFQAFSRITCSEKERVLSQPLQMRADKLIGETFGKVSKQYLSLLSHRLRCGGINMNSIGGLARTVATQMDNCIMGLICALASAELHAVLKWLWMHRYEFKRLEGLSSTQAPPPVQNDSESSPVSNNQASQKQQQHFRTKTSLFTKAGERVSSASISASQSRVGDAPLLCAVDGTNISKLAQHPSSGEEIGGSSTPHKVQPPDTKGVRTPVPPNNRARPAKTNGRSRRSSVDVTFDDGDKLLALQETREYSRFWGITSDSFVTPDVVLAPPAGLQRLPIMTVLPRPRQSNTSASSSPPDMRLTPKHSTVTQSREGLQAVPAEKDTETTYVEGCIKGCFSLHPQYTRELVEKGVMNGKALQPNDVKRRQGFSTTRYKPGRRASISNHPNRRRSSTRGAPRRASITAVVKMKNTPASEVRRRSSAFLRRFSLGSAGRASIESGLDDKEDEEEDTPSLASLLGPLGILQPHIQELVRQGVAGGEKKLRVSCLPSYTLEEGASYAGCCLGLAHSQPQQQAVLADCSQVVWCYGRKYELFSWAGLGFPFRHRSLASTGSSAQPLLPSRYQWQNDALMKDAFLSHLANVVAGKQAVSNEQRRNSMMELSRRKSLAEAPSSPKRNVNAVGNTSELARDFAKEAPSTVAYTPDDAAVFQVPCIKLGTLSSTIQRFVQSGKSHSLSTPQGTVSRRAQSTTQPLSQTPFVAYHARPAPVTSAPRAARPTPGETCTPSNLPRALFGSPVRSFHQASLEKTDDCRTRGNSEDVVIKRRSPVQTVSPVATMPRKEKLQRTPRAPATVSARRPPYRRKGARYFAQTMPERGVSSEYPPPSSIPTQKIKPVTPYETSCAANVEAAAATVWYTMECDKQSQTKQSIMTSLREEQRTEQALLQGLLPKPGTRRPTMNSRKKRRYSMASGLVLSVGSSMHAMEDSLSPEKVFWMQCIEPICKEIQVYSKLKASTGVLQEQYALTSHRRSFKQL